MHWSHKATIALLVIALILALNYYGVFKAILKQFKAEKIEEEKYVWVDASQYFEKTTIELKRYGFIHFEYSPDMTYEGLYRLKKIPLPCIIVLNFTETKYYTQYDSMSITIKFDKQWWGEIETSEGSKKVKFTGVYYTTFGGRGIAGDEEEGYYEQRGLSTDGVVVLDLTKEKVTNAYIVGVYIESNGVSAKIKILKIGFPKQ